MEIMVNLSHPCYEIDVYQIHSEEERNVALGQGYIPLRDLRELEEQATELARVKAELIKLKGAARELCNAFSGGHGYGGGSKNKALQRLGDLIDYPGYYALIH